MCSINLLGEPVQPLYGVVLQGHPYPNRLPSIPSPYTSYQPFYPNPPVYLPQIPQRPPVYYPPPPPPPSYQPLPVYSPPVHAPVVVPAYKPTTTYRPPAVRPPPYPTTPAQPTPYPSTPARPTPYPVRPTLPVPTSFDVKPWRPLYDSITSASYVLDPAVQLNTVDGYPWTEELRDGPETESIKAKLPDVLFYPSKSLAQQHAAISNADFNPHPERQPPFDNRIPGSRR